jgi:hypothetical protein
MMPPHDTYIETHLGGGAIMSRKLPALKKVHGCAHQFLSKYDFHDRELVYCVPTYLLYTLTSSRRYRFDYENHIALLEILKSLPCSVMISGYPSPLYDDFLTD